MGFFKDLLKEIDKEAGGYGAYLRGKRHALEGKPRMTWKRVHIKEYNQGYDDGLEERKINALENRNNSYDYND